MRFNVALRKKNCSEFLELEVLSYSDIAPTVEALHRSLLYPSVTITAAPLNDESQIIDKAYRNRIAETWIQRLITQSFGSGCEFWPHKSTFKGAALRILHRDHDLKRFTMTFLGTYQDTGFVKLMCSNKNCVNPLHLYMGQSRCQKIRDPDLVLEYIKANPHFSAREVATQIGCAPSAISRLTRGKTFKNKPSFD